LYSKGTHDRTSHEVVSWANEGKEDSMNDCTEMIETDATTWGRVGTETPEGEPQNQDKKEGTGTRLKQIGRYYSRTGEEGRNLVRILGLKMTWGGIGTTCLR